MIVSDMDFDVTQRTSPPHPCTSAVSCVRIAASGGFARPNDIAIGKHIILGVRRRKENGETMDEYDRWVLESSDGIDVHQSEKTG